MKKEKFNLIMNYFRAGFLFLLVTFIYLHFQNSMLELLNNYKYFSELTRKFISVLVMSFVVGLSFIYFLLLDLFLEPNEKEKEIIESKNKIIRKYKLKRLEEKLNKLK